MINKSKWYSKSVQLGVLSFLAVFFIFSVGFSSWALGKSFQNINVFNAQTFSVIDKGNYIYSDNSKGDNNSGVESLKYDSYGLIDDGTVGYVGHLKYYLIFNSSVFRESFSIASSNVTFSFALGYKNGFKSGYTLISSSFLSGTITISLENGDILYNNVTMNLTIDSNNIANCQSGSSAISSSTGLFYITADYIFNVQNETNFATVKSKEFADPASFSLRVTAEAS
jgi:hypothetical protein